MPDMEKVIEGLIQIRLHFEAMISICTNFRDYRGYDELREYTENAVSFIKGNDEVLQVNSWEDEYYGTVALCPKCECKWMMGNGDDLHFCPKCGQAVEWNS